ncbi:MAG TPA: GNAT family N-acetyltransferase [Clostridia bacterium]|nr:GNAT family N-acetyltransferase [Clostridia bacterium]
MSYIYRKAMPKDVRPALDLALKVFMEFDAPDYGTEHTKRMQLSIEDRINNFDDYLLDERLMFVALDNKKIVGMIETYGKSYQKNRVALMFVDSNYQRQGIATELINRTICELKMSGYDKIMLNSSPNGLPFYTHYGFIPAVTEKNINTPWKTPMGYIPNEIWDVYDENRNLTGRYIERGRPRWQKGNYHLVVHVWKRNAKGEWLIDRRTSRKTDNLGGLWETTGGSAVAGDSSLDAALREAKEELGLALLPESGRLFHSYINKGFNGYTGFIDVWVFDCDCSLADVVLQESETCDVMWASGDKIKEMIENGEFIGYGIYPYLDKLLGI